MTRFRRHSPISVRNFEFSSHVRPVMPPSSLSVRQERAFNKTLCASEYRAEFHGVTRAWGFEGIQRASRIRGWKTQMLETEALTRLWNIKFFSLLLPDCFMVWYLRAIGNGSTLALSHEIVDRICHQDDVRGTLPWKRVIVKRQNGVNGVIAHTW
jgi:hypothetical protein